MGSKQLTTESFQFACEVGKSTIACVIFGRLHHKYNAYTLAFYGFAWYIVDSSAALLLSWKILTFSVVNHMLTAQPLKLNRWADAT